MRTKVLLSLLFVSFLLQAEDAPGTTAKRAELTQLEEALLHQPTDGFIHYQVGLIYRQLGDDRKATQHLLSAMQNGFNNLGVKLNLMEAAFSSRQSSLALATAQQLIGSGLKSSDVLLRTGRALFDHLYYAEALKAFQFAQEAAPTAFEPRFRTALTYYLLREYSSTVASLNGADGTPETVALLASAQAKLGHFDKANAALRQSIAATPESPHSYINLALIDLDRDMDAAAEVLLQQFQGLNSQTQAKVFYTVSRNSCHALSEKAINKREASKEKADFYYQLAVQLQEHLNFSSAVELIRLTQSYEGDSARVLLLAGTSCLNQDPQDPEAVLILRQAIAHNPNEDRAYYLLGRAYSHIGKLDDAVSAFRKAVEIRPNASYYVSLGRALPNPKEAIVEFQNALSLDPSYAQAHLELGRAFVEVEQFSKARTELEHAIEIEPDFYEAYYLLGRLLHKMGDERQSKALLAQFAEKKAALSQQSVIGSGYIGEGN